MIRHAPRRGPGRRAEASPAPWSPATRLLFRVGLIYFGLWASAFYTNPIVGLLFRGIATVYQGACSAVVDVARAAFGGLLDPLRDPNTTACAGTTEASFVMLLVALFAAVVWSLIDRRPTSHPRLRRVLLGGCRYHLGAVLFTYGIMKLIPQQFAPPGLDRLLTAFGDQARVDVLWGLIGSAPSYQIFTGAIETAAALLLFFRKTSTLGAMLAVGATLNVTVLNFAYGIGVKLLSAHLLALAVILVLADWRRVVNLLWFRRAEAAPAADRWPERAGLRRSLGVAKVVLLGAWVVYFTGITVVLYRWSAQAADTPLHGSYDVTSFEVDGEPVPPLITSDTRWQNVSIVASPAPLVVRMMNDDQVKFGFEVSPDATTLTIRPWTAPDLSDLSLAMTPGPALGVEPIATFAYEERTDGEVLLQGTLRERSTEITLRERSLADFSLFAGPGRRNESGHPHVVLLLGLLISTGAVGWATIDRRRRSLARELVTTAASGYVGVVLCAFGFAKIFPAAFPFPTIQTLLTEFGQQSPAQGLWNVMGTSPAYTMFTGWTEVIAGTLLILPRSRGVGTLAAVAVLGHTVVATYAFDASLQVFSAHLLVITALLVLPDGRRLFNAFVRARATPGVDGRSMLSERIGARRVLASMGVLAAVAWTAPIGIWAVRSHRQAESKRNTPLYGLYDVQAFLLEGRDRPPLATDPTRWQSLIVEAPGQAVVQMMDDEFVRFELATDTLDRRIILAALDGGVGSWFAYRRSAPDMLHLKGTWNGRVAEITLRRRELTEFYLVRQPFEWIEGDYSVFW